MAFFRYCSLVAIRFTFLFHYSLTFACDVHFICWFCLWSYWFEQQRMDCISYFGSYLGSNITTLLFNNTKVNQAGQKLKSIYHANTDHLPYCIPPLNFLRDLLFRDIYIFEGFSILSFLMSLHVAYHYLKIMP